MNIIEKLAKMIGITTLQQSREKRMKAKELELKAFQDKIEAQKKQEEMSKQIKSIMAFPIKELSMREFVTLPRGEDVNFQTCELGTWFLCKPFVPLSDITVAGQVVRGLDLFTSQWGGGLSVPERGINRYRVQIK
ncbi:MAG: hypothetical protein WCV55_03165 [Candidatus Paceibacterota bacterium]